MSNKVVTLQNGIPKKTQKDHYDKSEVDAIISQKETESIQADTDTLTAAMDYTDQKITEVMGGVSPETLDTISEIAAALESEQTATGSILNQISDLQNDLATEQTTRQNADSALQAEVDQVETDLAVETQARIDGDTNTLSNANSYTDSKIAQYNNTGGVATQTENGLMSSNDKTKLDGIATGATANATDFQLRDRSTHHGTQVSSTISDFASTVRNTVLQGLNLTTSLAIAATDSVLSALGKIQAQINTMLVSVVPKNTGTANTVGTSTAVARADHTHNLEVTRFRVASQTPFIFSSVTFVSITGMSLTPTVAGTYWIDYSASIFTSSNGAEAAVQVFRNGVAVPDSYSIFTGRPSGQDTLSCGCEVVMNGTTDTIELRSSVSTGSVTVNHRRLRMMRVGV